MSNVKVQSPNEISLTLRVCRPRTIKTINPPSPPFSKGGLGGFKQGFRNLTFESSFEIDSPLVHHFVRTLTFGLDF